MEDYPLDPEVASREAVHKAKNAAQAIEVAREAQNAKMVEDTIQRTKDALLAGLKEVFGDGDSKDPEQMRVLVRRIPILCTNIQSMHEDIGDLKDGQKWAIRLIIGGIVSIIVAVVISILLK